MSNDKKASIRKIMDKYNLLDDDLPKLRRKKTLGAILSPTIIGFFKLYLPARRGIKQTEAKLEELDSKILDLLQDFIEKEKKKVIGPVKDTLKKVDKDVSLLRDAIVRDDKYLTFDSNQKAKNSLYATSHELESINTNDNHYVKIVNKKISDFLELDNPRSFLKSNEKLFTDKLKEQLEKEKVEVNDAKEFVKYFNPVFVEEKREEYASLFKKDGYMLDEDQQRAIIIDDTNNLVVAGAGSGKTDTLVTKIDYITSRKSDKIKSDRVLAIAFQSDAAGHIKDELKKGSKVTIKTFHALGSSIIKEMYSKKGKEVPQVVFANDNRSRQFNERIRKLISENAKDSKFNNLLINFIKLYGDSEIVKQESDFEKKEEFYEYMRNLTYTTLDGTKVKSEAEREIHNFLITHKLNGEKITVLYEDPAKWMAYEKDGGEVVPEPDFFLPDLNIYIENWAMGKSGKVPKWFAGEDPTKQYKEGMGAKKNAFKEQEEFHLVETSYADQQNGVLLKTLEESLVKALKEKNPKKKFEFSEMSYADIVEQTWQECKEVASPDKLANHVGRFIVTAKTYNLSKAKLQSKLQANKWSPKQVAFGELAIQVFGAYNDWLKKGNSIDFQDMINFAIDGLKKDENLCKDVYDYILVDEYQDISQQRFYLIEALLEKNNDCKLFCVGDDWQSIMGFTGSNLNFFVEFDKYFKHSQRIDLKTNYRSNKTIVDAGVELIKFNGENQLTKETIADDDTEHKIKVYSLLYKEGYENLYFEQMAKHCVDKIEELLDEGHKPKEFMILLRIKNKPHLVNTIINYAKRKKIAIAVDSKAEGVIPLKSVHGSKGLQARTVFILNVDKDLYGFPCEIENPDIYEPAIDGKVPGRVDEERRLFYVALTRAKKNLFIYTQDCKKSEFLDEIKDFTDIEKLRYNI